jgi:hypothetical protein
MRVQVKVGPTTIVEAEGATIQEVFIQLAQMQDVFGRVEKCGVCGGTKIRYIVRENNNYQFFNLQCENADCRARFGFGQPKNVKGGLFPQYKDKDGNWKANCGWEKYEPKEPVRGQHERHG